jgi:hypothetical protein
VLFAPFDGALEAGVALVRTFDEHVEVDVLDIHIDILVGHDLIDITDGAHHVQALIGRIYHFRPRLVLEDALPVLHGDNQVVPQLLRPLKQKHMADVEHVVDSEG